MGKSDKLASTVIATVTSLFGAIGEVIDATPRLTSQQASSYQKWRSEDDRRERSRSRRADTTARGYRRRGSSQQTGRRRKKYYEPHKNDDGSLNVNWM
ncbi:MAG: hypothetical protein PVI21_04080 [Candidatus Woesebacteria bacterium]|jgi:hypothetical protein